MVPHLQLSLAGDYGLWLTEDLLSTNYSSFSLGLRDWTTQLVSVHAPRRLVCHRLRMYGIAYLAGKRYDHNPT
jgi:hypothetical protein